MYWCTVHEQLSLSVQFLMYRKLLLYLYFVCTIYQLQKNFPSIVLSLFIGSGILLQYYQLQRNSSSIVLSLFIGPGAVTRFNLIKNSYVHDQLQVHLQQHFTVY